MIFGGLTLSEGALGASPGQYNVTVYATMDVMIQASYAHSNTVDMQLRATYIRSMLSDVALSAMRKHWYTTDVVLVAADTESVFYSQVIQNATSGPLF